MRRGIVVTLIASTLVPLAVAPAAVADTPGVVLENITFTTVDGSTLTGILGYPATGPPTTLVVMAHGYGHTVEVSWDQHVEATAAHGVAVVAMDYRDNLGFPALRGAQDLIEATKVSLARFTSVDRVILFGVSMGGAISGIALAEDTDDLYDYWFDIEGVSNIFETYAEAVAVDHPAAGQIETDAGGPPDEVPLEYVRRSPVLRAPEVVSGIRGAVLVHSLNDGLVPYDQGVEMFAALTALGVPTEFHTVLRGSGEEPDTQGTAALGLPNPLGLAGHASEASTTHPVMRTALDRLFAFLDDGDCPGTGGGVVDTAATFAANANVLAC